MRRDARQIAGIMALVWIIQIVDHSARLGGIPVTHATLIFDAMVLFVSVAVFIALTRRQGDRTNARTDSTHA